MPYRLLTPALFVLLFIFNSHAIFSQQNQNEFPFSQRVGFVPHPNTQEIITNDLLQHIADGSGRLRSMVNYDMAGSLLLKTEAGPNGRVSGYLFLNDLWISGHTIYRDFNLQSILRPDLLSLEVQIKGNNGKIIFSEKLSGLVVSHTGEVIHHFELPKINSQTELLINISKIHFSYSPAAYQRLNIWFGHLEEYYRAGAGLDSLLHEVNEIRFDNPDKLILSEFELCEAERGLELIARMGFFNSFKASDGDPEKVFYTFEDVKGRIETLRLNFNQKMAHIDSLLYESGRELFNRGEITAAMQRFESALTLNPFHIPSHLAIAEIDLDLGHKTRSINRLSNVFSIMFPYGEWRSKAEAFSDTLMTRFFREAFNLNREGRFKESLDLLAPLESFCEKTLGLFPCPDELNFRLTQAHMGMYRSFLVVGNRALRNDNLHLCRIYTIAAADYQQNNIRFIPDAKEAYDILQKVIDRHLELATAHFDAARYLQAAGHYQEAADLCSKFTDLLCAPNLLQRQQLALDLHKSQSTIATNETPVASLLTLPETLALPPLAGHPRQKLLDKIRFGQLQAWAGNLDVAREAQQDAIRISSRFIFDTDHLLIYEFRELDRQIVEKECELASRQIDVLVSRGINLLHSGEISLAAEAGRNATEISHANTRCNSSNNHNLNELKKLQYAATFMNMVDDAKSSYASSKSGNYNETLTKFYEAERFFSKNLPDVIKTGRYSLPVFIAQSGNEEFVRAGIYFMTGYASIYEREIVKQLAVLRNAGVPSRETQALQILAGSKLANHYFSLASEQLPRQIVQNLTDGDKWFRFFEKAFLRNWPGR